eukprot:gb/GECG01005904.1/.p1 GENE.gb/GECG01005904.1/~~gb/GECG01005904.1/.p1  ORF type:complete len:132 (+),score=7.79 gb/GECG01005904.1/:1-396(+)
MVHTNPSHRPTFLHFTHAFVQKLGKFVPQYHVDNLTKIFPTLFPFGRGGLDETRRVPLSEASIYKRLLRVSSKQFQNKTFISYAFDQLSRKNATQAALLTLPGQRFQEFSQLTQESLHQAIEYKGSREQHL